MKLQTKITLGIVVELIYIVGGRYVASNFHDFTPNSEYLRTILRVFSVIAYYYIFKDYILSFKPSYKFIKSPHIAISVILFLITPLLVGNLYFMGDYTRVLFAVTSIIVGLKEELVFRVLIQNSLETKIGTIYAILITSLIFTAWHYGAIPNNLFAFGQVLVSSIFLGLIYSVTKSFLLVVSLHAVYDALWSLTPIYSNVLSYNWGLIPLVSAMLITANWYYNANKSNEHGL